MFNPFAVLLLSMEAQKVIERRLVTLAWGGRLAQQEAALMVNEKVSAGLEAAQALMSGATVDTVVSRYREHVAANSIRLAA